jgi:PhnB protein
MAKKKIKRTVKKAASKKPAAKKVVKKAAKKPVKKAVSKKPAAKKVVAKKPVRKAASRKPAAQQQPIKKSTALSPYINFDGNCEEAFNFYKSVFGGEFGMVQKFNSMPPMGDHPIPESEGNKIMHISLPISQETTLMGSDTSESFGHRITFGNNFAISINTFSQGEADRLFNGLADGGQITMPIAKTFWNAYFGMLTDKFGIQWMVNYDLGQGGH